MDEKQRGELHAIAELQTFLLDELSDWIEPERRRHFQNAFEPITDGLGLDAPSSQRNVQHTAAPAAPTPEVSKPVYRPLPETDIVIPKHPVERNAQERPRRPSDGRLSRALSGESAVELPGVVPVVLEPERPFEFEERVTPPSLPFASVFRRAMAGGIDIVLVCTLWCFLALATAHYYFGISVSRAHAAVVDNRVFVRMMFLEYAALWMAYLGATVGLFSTTFGMWVWGLRVHYGALDDDSKFLKRVVRIVWSFLFLAPLAPTLLLAVQIARRNLIDLLSGTGVYRSHR